jgi:hypothetical protein
VPVSQRRKKKEGLTGEKTDGAVEVLKSRQFQTEAVQGFRVVLLKTAKSAVSWTHLNTCKCEVSLWVSEHHAMKTYRGGEV